MAKCANHPDLAANSKCVQCDKDLCVACVHSRKANSLTKGFNVTLVVIFVLTLPL